MIVWWRDGSWPHRFAVIEVIFVLSGIDGAWKILFGHPNMGQAFYQVGWIAVGLWAASCLLDRLHTKGDT